MSIFRQHEYTKTMLYTLSGIVLLFSANSYGDVSQSPLGLTQGVSPNIILTLDDSGSMHRAYAPDNISSKGSSRAAKSSSYNALYFNPSVTYEAPAVFDKSGVEKRLSTSFSAAWLNGYHTKYGSIDLSKNYKATWTYNLTSSAGNSLSNNPTADFSASATVKNNSSKTITRNAGISFTLKVNADRCTATASMGGINNISADCTRSGANTYTANLTRSGVPAYYYVYDKTLASNCTITNDNCYTLNFVSTSQQQNFANWYSFYRNRALTTVSSAALAFYDLSSSVRLTWQDLNHCTNLNGTRDASPCYGNKFQEYSTTHKGQLYTWLQNITFSGSTYLPLAMQKAGNFLKTSTAWQKNPNGSGNTEQNTYACRASYHIMMTDGEWSSSVGIPEKHDSTNFTLPDGMNYTHPQPYYGRIKDTLADQAMHYWATDLNPNLSNSLDPYIQYKSTDTASEYWDPRNDPATWQHMTNFIMGLGLTQSMDIQNIPWEGSTFSGTGYSNLLTGAVAWPDAAGSKTKENVYDLWHAAINSRGEFFSVDNPQGMVQAFEDILTRIGDRKSTASRPAVSSGQTSADVALDRKVFTVAFQSSYASDENWSGNLKMTRTAWNTQDQEFESTEVWNAETQMPSATNRNIKIAGEDQSGLVDFSWANAGSANTEGTLAHYLNRDPENANIKDDLGELRLNYLRGDRSEEGRFRQRSGVLGDFYSSTPVVVRGARMLVSLANNLESTDSYTAFASQASKRSQRVYIGGNDGMLHGFNAETGREEFAFIPSNLFSKLNKLTGSNYSHQFYVDGSPVVSDVYDRSGNQWRTILVGTLEAGGKSVFALDITTPGQEQLLWEFDDSSLPESASVKMGYSFSQPTIARLHTGKWAVVFGNGYDSSGNSNGKAALFILDAITGELLKSLEVQGDNTAVNGLSTPKLADYNADGVADYAYAGDLQGNIWRFDLLGSNRNSSNPFTTSDDSESVINDFEVAYSASSAETPLFKASFNNTPQPITSAPSLVLHPTGKGYLVIFGTGKFFETGDKEGNKSIAQSIYGIWDKQTLGENANDPGISRSSLQEQTIENTLTVSDGGSSREGRIISNNAITWSDQNGWRLDLEQSDGEMVVENMSQLGNTILIQSLVPNDDPCADGTSNWTYALNPATGGRTSTNTFEFLPTTDQDITNVSAIRQDGEGGGTLAQHADGSFQYCTGQECVTVLPDPSTIGRQSWRHLDDKE